MEPAKFRERWPPAAAPPTKKVSAMNIIQELEKEQAAALQGGRTIPEFAPGDTVRVILAFLTPVNYRFELVGRRISAR